MENNIEYPSFNRAKAKAAVRDYAVLYKDRGVIGAVWWEGPTCCHRAVLLIEDNNKKSKQ